MVWAIECLKDCNKPLFASLCIGPRGDSAGVDPGSRIVWPSDLHHLWISFQVLFLCFHLSIFFSTFIQMQDLQISLLQMIPGLETFKCLWIDYFFFCLEIFKILSWFLCKKKRGRIRKTFISQGLVIETVFFTNFLFGKSPLKLVSTMKKIFLNINTFS